MFLGEIITKYRNENDITMDAFAEKSGLSKGYVSMLENNRNPKTGNPIVPSLLTFQKVASAINISLTDLIQMVDRRQIINLNTNNIQFHPKARRINVYGRIPAGMPIESITDIVDWEEIPADWHGEYIALQVKGDSMEPEYRDSDVIIVRVQPDCESGQDCALYVNGYDATLKRVIKRPDHIMLQPLNHAYEPKTYAYGDPNGVTILGVVVEMRRRKI